MFEEKLEGRSSLTRSGLRLSQQLHEWAADLGFDWPDWTGVLAKVREETDEIQQAIENGEEKDRLAEEVGDLLLVTVNLARHLGIDAEQAVILANKKFQRRVDLMLENLNSQGKQAIDCTLEELEKAWQAVKKDQ